MQSDTQRHTEITSYRLDDLYRYCNELFAAQPGSGRGNLRTVVSELLNRLRQNLHFDYLSFTLHDSNRDIVTVVFEAGEFQLPLEVPVLDTSLGIVLHEQRAIEVNDVDSEQRFSDLLPLARQGGFRSFRIVPLSTDRNELGTLGVGRRRPGIFSSEDIRHLDHAAQLVALILENALMAEALMRDKARLEMLLDVNTTLISSLDMQKLFRDVSGLIQRVVFQDLTHLALYDRTHDAMSFYIVDSGAEAAVVTPDSMVPVRECPAGIAYLRGETQHFNQCDMEGIGTLYTQKLLESGIRSMSCFPLTIHSRKLGVLGLASLRDNLPSEDDLLLLTQIASQVAVAVDNARSHNEIAKLKDKLSKEKLYLEEEIRSQHNFGEVIGNSPALLQVLKQVEIAAKRCHCAGTGRDRHRKGVSRRAVHRLSSRREGNFIKLNCAAIPTGLLESELFGHEKGAFTGAISQKMGRLELADKGTLFLDEIGEISMELQPKLLRVLQDHEFERLGGVRTIRVNVRLIAATNRNLAEAVHRREFRSDLYYRLNVFPIRLPALRERRGDIPMLVRYFVQKFARRMGKNIESIPVDIIRDLEQWHWPGNIRELENFMERLVILTQGPVLFAPMAELHMSLSDRNGSVGSTLEDVERDYILRTLRESGGIIAGLHGAAARLGMKRTTLQSRMQKLGITREEYET